jgi:class 3 adenylate cyclase
MAKTPSYKMRYENLARVAEKITSSLNIGDILEIIRDEAKVTIPHAQEACLLILDPDAGHYTRPLHCSVFEDRLNCQLCKRGRKTVQRAVTYAPSELECAFQPDQGKCRKCSLGLSTHGAGKSESASLSEIGSVAPTTQVTHPVPCDIALPIYDDGEPLAVLELIAKKGKCFGERDVVLLRDLTHLATNAIVNARNHWKISREKMNMDRILTHLRPFVPETVQRIVEKDPASPHLGKKDMDVSILFLDVAGYTKISESLTQEKVNFIIEKYFSGFLDVIYHHGGDINETAGDGLMAIFQRDPWENALNASHAALEIREKTVEINQELQGRFEPIAVNMGINSGVASVGMTQFHGAAGTRMTYTASGAVTNLAARIAAAATDGEILVGPETAHRTGGHMQLYDRGVMRFKNVKGDVQVFTLVGPKEAA